MDEVKNVAVEAENVEVAEQVGIAEEKTFEPVVLYTSKFKKEVNTTVVRKLEAWADGFTQSRRYMEHFAEKGVHYIFKMVKILNDGEAVAFHVEAKTSDASGLYATAKVQQLEAFPWQSHTGGETIGQVRGMLLDKGLSEQEAANFYAEYDPETTVEVISDDAAVWLRDQFGIAPWYGALRFPCLIKVFGTAGKVKEKNFYIDSGFSGCQNSQEDLLYNVELTNMILETFASAWGQDVIKLDLSELCADPVTETWVYHMSLDSVVMPK